MALRLNYSCMTIRGDSANVCLLRRAITNYYSVRPEKSVYTVGAQNNRLIETIILSIQNICLNRWITKNHH